MLKNSMLLSLKNSLHIFYFFRHLRVLSYLNCTQISDLSQSVLSSHISVVAAHRSFSLTISFIIIFAALTTHSIVAVARLKTLEKALLEAQEPCCHEGIAFSSVSVGNCYGFMDEDLLETLLATFLGEAKCCYLIRSSVSRLDPLSTHRYLLTDRLA